MSETPLFGVYNSLYVMARAKFSVRCRIVIQQGESEGRNPSNDLLVCLPRARKVSANFERVTRTRSRRRYFDDVASRVYISDITVTTFLRKVHRLRT